MVCSESTWRGYHAEIKQAWIWWVPKWETTCECCICHLNFHNGRNAVYKQSNQCQVILDGILKVLLRIQGKGCCLPHREKIGKSCSSILHSEFWTVNRVIIILIMLSIYIWLSSVIIASHTLICCHPLSKVSIIFILQKVRGLWDCETVACLWSSSKFHGRGEIQTRFPGLQHSLVDTVTALQESLGPHDAASNLCLALE